jgi:hypothetical protein
MLGSRHLSDTADSVVPPLLLVHRVPEARERALFQRLGRTDDVYGFVTGSSLPVVAYASLFRLVDE